VKKYKKGSTLMVTIIIFMFVTTVSFAFLSMITTNYYGRTSESRRVQNLYGSESGLDTTYNVISKTVQAANVSGYAKVENLKTEVKSMDYEDYTNPDTGDDEKALYALYADIDYWKYYNGNLEKDQEPLSNERIAEEIKKDNDYIDKFINKVFKDEFKDFMKRNLESSVNNTSYVQMRVNKRDDGILELQQNQENIGLNENTKIQIKKDTEKLDGQQNTNEGTENTKVYTTNGDAQKDESKEEGITPKPQGKAIDVKRKLNVECGYSDDGRILYDDSYELTFSLYNEEDYDLKITSEFRTVSDEANNTRIGDNLRVIEANYSIRVPNYNEIAVKESAVDLEDNIKDIASLSVGGDLKVQEINKLNVSGDIFVQGKDISEANMTNDNRTYEKYSGGIMLDASGSKKTINFNDNVFTRGTFNVKNNVNVTVNGDLYAKNIYAGDSNDFSNNSKLTINKEAVIDNDLAVKATNTQINITDFYGINDKNVDSGTKVRKSSSIIINGYKTNEENKSTITISDKAYLMGVAHINTADGYQTGESVAVKGNYKAYSVPDPEDSSESFKYDDPLQVLDTNDLDKKINHFISYWQRMNKSGLESGGVSLPANTFSIGAVVSNGEVAKSLPYTQEIETNVIQPKRLKYSEKVYALGDKNANTQELYESMGTNARGVADLLGNLNNLEASDYNLRKEDNKGQEMAIFCPIKKTIVIQGKNPYIDNYPEDEYKVIDARSEKDVNAVIITAGNIIIDGEVNFRGDIIAQGDLTVQQGAAVNIYYDKNMTESIQRNNKVLFNKVYGNNSVGEELQNDYLNINSNSSNFFKTKLWKVIQ